MDGTTNPGPWIGWKPWSGANTAGCAPQVTAFTFDLAAMAAAGPLTACVVEPPASGYAPCGCYKGPWWGVVPPPRCPVHAESAAPFAPMMPTTTTTTLRFTPTPPALSDSDVDRIARRVVELFAARPTGGA